IRTTNTHGHIMLEAHWLEQLQAVVGADGWLSDPQATAGYTCGWQGLYEGAAAVVLRPASTDEVSAIVRICAEADIAIVPQGGNTGLAGGAVPDQSGRQVIVSLQRMNRIRDLDAQNHTI